MSAKETYNAEASETRVSDKPKREVKQCESQEKRKSQERQRLSQKAIRHTRAE